mgnify:CR=1 FL=1
MAKWRLLSVAVPVTAVVLGIRYLVHDVLGYKELVSFGDAGPVITGAALILGLMLSGVMGDYKESEKLPSAVAGGIAGFEGLAVRGLQMKDADTSWVRPRIAKVAQTIDDWFYSRATDEEVGVATGDLNVMIQDLEKAGVPTHYLARLFVAAGDLGGAISRIQTIRNTNFIKSGYALMELLIAAVLGLMILVDFPSPNVQWIVAGALSLVYIYMLLLVKDLDNPFGYGDNGGRGSAADVDLTPWLNVAKNLGIR